MTALFVYLLGYILAYVCLRVFRHLLADTPGEGYLYDGTWLSFMYRLATALASWMVVAVSLIWYVADLLETFEDWLKERKSKPPKWL